MGRSTIVFGVGNPNADLMFIVEGPGADEDRQGEPFVGRAGQLLTEIITKGMKLHRQDVYIANILKCRPPGNRNPEADEIGQCLPFLARQIDLVKPRVIVALGTFAAQTLLEVKTPITRLRGVWHQYRGVKVMPTFHPAYLLRTPGDKRLVWADIKLVMAALGLPS
jgi:DNA polymerase